MRSPSGFFSGISSALSEGRHWTSRALGNPRLFMAIGLIALVVFLFLFADTVEIGLAWAGIALGIFLLL